MKNFPPQKTESSINITIIEYLMKSLSGLLKKGCLCAVDISPFYSSTDTENSFWRGVYALSGNQDESDALLNAFLKESAVSINKYYNLYLHPLMTFLKDGEEVKSPIIFREELPLPKADGLQGNVDDLLKKAEPDLENIQVDIKDLKSKKANGAVCSYFFDPNCNNIKTLVISENARIRRNRIGTDVTYDGLHNDYRTIARLQHQLLRKLCKGTTRSSLQFIYPLNSSTICHQANDISFFDKSMDDSYLGGIWIYVFLKDGLTPTEVHQEADAVIKTIDQLVNALRLEIVPTLFSAKMAFAEKRENDRIRESQKLIAMEFAKNRSMESLYRIFLDAFENDPRLSTFKDTLCFFDYNINMEDRSLGAVLVPGDVSETTSSRTSDFYAFGAGGVNRAGSSSSTYFKNLNADFLSKKITVGGCPEFLQGLTETNDYVERFGDFRCLYVEITPRCQDSDCKSTTLVAGNQSVLFEPDNPNAVVTPDNTDLKANLNVYTDKVVKDTYDMNGRSCCYYIATPFMEQTSDAQSLRNIAQLYAGFSSKDDKEKVVNFLSAVNDITVVLRGFIKTEYDSRKSEREKLESAYTAAAIGSIMSRNGSHNIGSHVLSSLSHYVGTMPDDRVLYQYIQQRMDYTATVTTDFPDWTAPTRFVANLMKMFFSQRHLLDHISESEGLEAYHFHGRNVVARQTGKIKIHLRRVNPDKLPDGDPGADIKNLIVSGSRSRAVYPGFCAKNLVVKCAVGQQSSGKPGSKQEPPPVPGSDKTIAVPGSVEPSQVIQIEKATGDSKAEKRRLAIWKSAYSADYQDQWIEFTQYPDSTARSFSLLDDDVSLAIPGGVVGQHAFYTIIENIIRNAAKHDWAGKDHPTGNLEIYIDFIDWKDTAQVEFTIWNVCNKLNIWSEKDGKNAPDPLSPDDVRDLLKKMREAEERKNHESVRVFDGRPLHHQLQMKLAQSLIDKEGQLRRENWGLAEMKISAGYLQRRSIEEIGGLKPIEDPIITPVAVPDLDGRTYHLGYRFSVPKPKKILIVLSGDEEVLPPEKEDVLKKEGIYVKTIQEIINGPKNERNNLGHIALAYEYVVLPYYVLDEDSKPISFDPPIEKWLLPFRVLIEESNLNKAIKVFSKRGTQIDTFSEIDYEQLMSSDNGEKRISSDPQKIKEAVYTAWLLGLKKKCNLAERGSVYLQVQADAASSGGGKGLVADLDLYHVVFNECAHSVLMAASIKQKNPTAKRLTTLLALTPLNEVSYLLSHEGENSSDYIRKQLHAFCGRFKHEFHFSEAFKKSLCSIISGFNGWIEKNVGQDVNSFELAFLRNVQLDLLNGSDFVKKRVRDLIKHLNAVDSNLFNAELDIFCGDLDASQLPPYASRLEFSGLYDADAPRGSMFQKNIAVLFGPADSDTAKEFSILVDKLNSAYLASDIFLRKYEENIATLPLFYKESFRKKNDDGMDDPDNRAKPLSLILNQCGSAAPAIRNDGGNEPIVIRYVRHDNNGDGHYMEALSGSQSYLNALAQFSWSPNQIDLIVRLVENAMLRVLVLDERVFNFLKSRNDELTACRKMQIFAVDVYGENTSFNPNANGFVMVEKNSIDKGLGIEPNYYDILIIHQGIIDKWVSASEKQKGNSALGGLHDLEKVRNLLTSLKNVVPYVVVTTGRGRPDNIPDDARVLPFSTIESTLFRKYPEKLVLVNTVMNILPVNLAKNDSSAADQNNPSGGTVNGKNNPSGGTVNGKNNPSGRAGQGRKKAIVKQTKNKKRIRRP